MSHFKKPNNLATQKMKRVQEEEEAEREKHRRRREESSHERRLVFTRARKRPHWK
jgi:hypothetical protein